MCAGGRGQRTFIHRVKVLGLVQGALVFSTGAPAAVGTENDGFTSFHIALQLNTLRPSSTDVKSTFLIVKIGKNYRTLIIKSQKVLGPQPRSECAAAELL